jgi:hypothetical protein
MSCHSVATRWGHCHHFAAWQAVAGGWAAQERWMGVGRQVVGDAEGWGR